jgi:hypothetical protein
MNEEPSTPTALESLAKLPASQASRVFESAIEAIARSQHLRKPDEHTSCAIPVIYNILSQDHTKFDCALTALNHGITQQQQLPKPTFKPKKKSTTALNEKIRKLFEERFDELAVSFSSLDINQDGMISWSELLDGLKGLDWQLNESDIRQVMEFADQDRNGLLDMYEFLRYFGPHSITPDEIADGLHQLGRTAQGTRMAYLSLRVTNARINDASGVAAFVHLQNVDLSNNQARHPAAPACTRAQLRPPALPCPTRPPPPPPPHPSTNTHPAPSSSTWRRWGRCGGW